MESELVTLPPARRPNTIAPTVQYQVSIDELNQMTDMQLIAYADQVCGIVIPYGTKRGTILTRLVNAATVIRDDP